MSKYLVQHLIDSSTKLFPDKTAVCNGRQRMTYEELSISTNKLANCLISNGVKHRDRVAFFLKRSIKCIISMIGVLKADAVYVPIDIKYPEEMLGAIILNCRPKAIICGPDSLDIILTALQGIECKALIVVIGEKNLLSREISYKLINQTEINKSSSQSPIYNNIGSDGAYIIYTSGSTGKSKGVVISHLNILSYINWAIDYLNLTQDDNILNTSPFYFDMSTFDIYCALAVGATLVIAPDESILFPGELITLIEENEVSVWKAISSLLVYLSKTGPLKPNRLTSLKKILFGGEILPVKHLAIWMDTYPEKSFYNVYGATETTGISICHNVKQKPKSQQEVIPIGGPIAKTEIYLLNEDNTQVKTNEVGELCIRGPGVSVGYWGDLKKTNEVFVNNPISNIPDDKIYKTGDYGKRCANGNFLFIGRKDFQVKYMGYRINLNEIESIILGIEDINECAVVLSPGDVNDFTEIIAFFEAETKIHSTEIHDVLKKSLLPYMIPHHIFPINQMQRNDRGKINRDYLIKHYLCNLQKNSKPKV